ncbi:UNVERIFIED_CONTAM: hypothetical protein HDU68_005041, partial [Siphonaria sp. JEL0065]
MDDLEEYEERFPFRGRTPGGTHHPRSHTHDPDDHHNRNQTELGGSAARAGKENIPQRAATSDPIKSYKKKAQEVAITPPPKTMTTMTSTEPEEPLVSIPSRHQSAKPVLQTISKPNSAKPEAQDTSKPAESSCASASASKKASKVTSRVGSQALIPEE